MLKETNIFSNFISKFLQGRDMVEDSSFFKKKFTDYYNIDIGDIEKLLLQEFDVDDLLAISLSDYKSKIVLFSTGDEVFQENLINNNDNVIMLINNLNDLNNSDNFEEFMVTTDIQIDINVYIRWKRNFILHIIFDIKETNLALANNKTKLIINNIKKILENE